jgi:hypothetical protein
LAAAFLFRGFLAGGSSSHCRTGTRILTLPLPRLLGGRLEQPLQNRDEDLDLVAVIVVRLLFRDQLTSRSLADDLGIANGQLAHDANAVVEQLPGLVLHGRGLHVSS